MSQSWDSMGTCPECQSDDLDYNTTLFEDEYVVYRFKCNDCAFEGKEWYSLNYVETTEVKEAKEDTL